MTKRSSNIGILIALAAIGAASLMGTASAAADPGAVSIIAGQPYLFIIRLDADETLASSVLESKGATNIEYGPASNPPFWASPEILWSQRIVSFRVTPAGNATVAMGDAFYGLGRIERIVPL